MQIETSFTVPAPLDRAWAILTDVPAIVPCMPGAQLTEVVDPRTFRGTASVKIGPMALSFSGEARIEEQDDAAHRVRVAGKGNDMKGRGGAQAKLDFVLVADGERTRVDITTDLQLNGAVAQYGRGVGLIKEIANQLVGQFAANLGRQIAVAPAPEAPIAPPDLAAVPDAGVTGEATPPAPPAATPPGAAPVPGALPVSPAPVASAAPVSALRLLFAALRAIVGRWLRGGRGT